MKIKAIDILIAFLMLCILYAIGLLCVVIARKSAGITEIPWDLGLRNVTETAPPAKIETPEETLHNRLSAQSEQLNELFTAGIPQARKALSGDMDKIDADIASTTNETTLVQLRTELRSIAHKQLVLESLEKDASEARIRLRSMLRMLEQDRKMPAGIMEDFENSFKFVSQLANGDFYASLEKIDIDPGMVEARTEELWNAAGQRRIAEAARRGQSREEVHGRRPQKNIVALSEILSEETIRIILSGGGVRITNKIPNTKITALVLSNGNETLPLVEENGVWRLEESFL